MHAQCAGLNREWRMVGLHDLIRPDANGTRAVGYMEASDKNHTVPQESE